MSNDPRIHSQGFNEPISTSFSKNPQSEKDPKLNLYQGHRSYKIGKNKHPEWNIHTQEIEANWIDASPKQAKPLFKRAIASEKILKKKWEEPSYWKRFNLLIKTNSRKKNSFEGGRLIPNSEAKNLIRRDTFYDLGKDLMNDLGSFSYDWIKTFRNILGAPIALYESLKKDRAARKSISKLSGIHKQYYQLQQTIQLSLNIDQFMLSINEKNDELTASSLKKLLLALNKKIPEHKQVLSAKSIEALQQLNKFAKAKPDSKIELAALEKILEQLIGAQKELIHTQTEALFFEFLKIKNNLLNKETNSETIEKLKTQYKPIFEEELNQFIDKYTIKINETKNISEKIKFFSAILISTCLKASSIFFKILGLLGIPFALGIGRTIQSFCTILEAGISGKSLHIDSQKMLSSYQLKAKTSEFLQRYIKNDLIEKKPPTDEGATWEQLNYLETKAILKSIKKQQSLVEKSLKFIYSSLSLSAAFTTIALMTLKIALLLGISVGVIVSMANPITLGLIGASLATAVIYSFYSCTRWLNNTHLQYKWEASLQECLTLSYPNNEKELKQRSTLYKHLYSKALEKDLSPQKAHFYVYKKCLSKALQYDKTLLVESICERFLDETDKDIESILLQLNLMDEPLIRHLRHLKKDQKIHIIEQLNYALGFVS